MSEKLTHVKWASSNMPMIKVVRNNTRLYLTKRELLSLRDEIDEFISYYSRDFVEPVLDFEDITIHEYRNGK